MIFLIVLGAYLVISGIQFLRLTSKDAYRLAHMRNSPEHEEHMQEIEKYENYKKRAWAAAKANWLLKDNRINCYNDLMANVSVPEPYDYQMHYGKNLLEAVGWLGYLPLSVAMSAGTKKANNEHAAKIAELENLKMLRAASTDNAETIQIIDDFAKTRGFDPLDLTTPMSAR